MSYYYSNRAVNGRTGTGRDTAFLSKWFSGNQKADTRDPVQHGWQAPTANDLPRPGASLPRRRESAPDATAGDLASQIMDFQRQNGLKQDGLVLPSGETAQKINHLAAGAMKTEGDNPALPLMAGLENDVERHFPKGNTRATQRENTGRNSYRHALMSYRLASQFGDGEARQFEKALLNAEPVRGQKALKTVLGKARDLAADPDLQMLPDDEVVRDALQSGSLGRLYQDVPGLGDANANASADANAASDHGRNIRQAFGVADGEAETWLAAQPAEPVDIADQGDDMFGVVAADPADVRLDSIYADHNKALMR